MASTFYDPKQLLQAVPIAPELRSYTGGTSLNEDDAILQLLRSRFGYEGTTLNDLESLAKAFNVEDRENGSYRLLFPNRHSVGKGYKPGDATWHGDNEAESPIVAMLRTIVKALPEEYRTAEFLGAVDIRPWLRELSDKNIPVRVNISMWPDKTLGSDDFGGLRSNYVNDAIAATTTYTSTILNDTIKGTPNYDAAKKVIDDAMIGFGNTASALPSVETMSGTANQNIAAAFNGQNSEQSNTVSEDDMRRLFIQRGGTDIMGLESLYQEKESGGYTVPEDATLTLGLNVNSIIQGTPSTTNQASMGPQLSEAFTSNRRYNYREAADYLYSGQVTPGEVTILQRKMVSAGLFDDSSMADGYAAGDVFDDNTNLAWRNLLGEAYKRKLSVSETLSVLTRERHQKTPALRSNINKRVFNMAAHDLIGRDLTDEEQAGLVSYLQGLSNTKGIAALGADPMTGYSSADVTGYIANRMDSEIDAVTRANSSPATKATVA